MLIVNNTKPDKKNVELVQIQGDISNYWNLFGSNGFSSTISLRYLPFDKGYFELPYWLIYKINFILELINKCVDEKEKLKNN